jgi:hypothetical protein
MIHGGAQMNDTAMLFFESNAAAQSQKNNWTRLASTFGCISIALSKDMLIVKPHWFAIWMITALGLDLNHEIPVSQIKGVTQTGNWFGYGMVEVDFMTDANESRTLLLYLKKDSDFIEAVNSMIAE